MPITPLEVRKKLFATQLRGYSPREVRSFLELVAKEMEELRRDRGLLAEKVDGLAAKLETHERTEGLLKDTLLTAQRATDDLRSGAEEKAKSIVAEAELKAGEIAREARTKAERLRSDLGRLEMKRANLLDQIRGIAQTYLSMTERLESQPVPSPEDEAKDTGKRRSD